MIPKYHGAKLIDIPDDTLTEILVCSSVSCEILGSNMPYILPTLVARTLVVGFGGPLVVLYRDLSSIVLD